MEPLDSLHRLRGVLRANAAFSAAGGIAALAAFAPIDDALGTGNRAVVALVGAGLVGFALFLVRAAGAEPRRLLRSAAIATASDVAWIATSALVLGTVDLNRSGVAALAAVAVVVAGFASSQLRLRRAASRIADLDTPVPERIDVEHPVAAPASSVWPLLTDHELYGRLAPNLSRVEVLDGEGEGMRRRCTDTRGRGWDETCTMWEEGHAFAVEVDTSDYPYPLTTMRGRWAVEPRGAGSVISMRFEFTPRAGLVGGVFAIAMLGAFRPVLHRIVRGWERQLANTGATADSGTASPAPRVQLP